MKTIILAFFLFLSVYSNAQIEVGECIRLHHSKLKYIGKNGQSDFVQIDGNNHLEFVEEGGEYIKSTLIWNSDCEYTAKIVEITFTDGFFKPGDELRVKIVRIVGNTVTMLATFKEVEFEFSYEILEYL